MSLKPGRNDPCHCGSGKKYKKCHLIEDEARESDTLRAEAAGAMARLDRAGPDMSSPGRENPLSAPPRPGAPYSLPMLPPAVSPPDLSPEQEAQREAWDQFANADLEGKVSIFRSDVESGDIEVDSLFEMLAEIHPAAVAAGTRGTFREVVEFARERVPELYAEERAWYVSWLIEDALAELDHERVPALVTQLEGVVEKNPDEVLRIIDVLMFHGHVEPLIAMLTHEWPVIAASTEIMPHGVAEFATTLTMLTIFHHLDHGGAPRIDDPALRAALEPLGMFDEPRLQQSIDALSGAVTRDWQPDDFVRVAVDDDDDDERDDPDWNDPASLKDLESLKDIEYDTDYDPVAMAETIERSRLAFESDDTAEEDDDDGILGSKYAEADDHDRDDPNQGLKENLLILTLELAGALRRDHGIPLARTEVARDTLLRYLLEQPVDRKGRLLLLPQKRSAEARLAGLMSFFSSQHVKSGALFTLLPAYIDMLASRGMVKRDAARRARAEILTLRSLMHTLVAEATNDPILAEAVAAAGG